MHSNRNSKAVNRVSKGLLKANKSRNIFAAIAIIMTAFMITTVFSLGISYKENYDTFVIRQAGTVATISLNRPTNEQYEKMKSLDYLDFVGKRYYIGDITKRTAENTDVVTSLFCYDKIEYEEIFMPAISNIQGNYPQNSNEIMMSEGALEQLGISNPIINQTIQLAYETQNGIKSGEYKLSGYFKSYAANVKNVILFSETYCKNNNLTLEENGRVDIYDKDDSQAYELLVQDINLNENQKFDSQLKSSNMDSTIQIAALIILIVLFIMISGFLLIYNVFYISVSKEINRYGMLKVLGTSQKQIQKIIINQAISLAGIAIPIGLALSAVISFEIVPIVLKSLAGNDFDRISFSPVIFICATVFSIATVFISAWKPAKMAGKISPVEALRYNTVQSSFKNKKTSKSKNGSKVYKMAWRNIFRNKKQTILVVISIFLGSMTMLCINGFIGSMSAENYVEEYCKDDFAFVSTDIDKEQFSDELINLLKNINGLDDFVTSSTTFLKVNFDEKELEHILKYGFESSGGTNEYYQNFIETMQGVADEGEYGAWIQTLDLKYIEEYNKTHEEQINLQDFEEGKICISLGEIDFVGSTLTLIDDSNIKSEIKIDGVFKYGDVNYHVINPWITSGTPGVIFVSDKFLNSIDCKSRVYSVAFNVDEDNLELAEAKVKDIAKTLTSANYQLYIKSEVMQGFEEDMMSLRIIGNSVSLFLLAIGILNFINIMMTGIYSRRREFAVMQSIGVTTKQIRKLLSFEGIYYALMTTILILTLGSSILLAEAKIIPSVADYAVFKYPVVPLLILIGCISFICLAIPFIVYKSSAKSTVTERLRDIEN